MNQVFVPLALVGLIACGHPRVNTTLAYSSTRLPAHVGFVVGFDATRLKQTALWNRVGPKLAAFAASDEKLAKAKAACDLDPVRDLRWMVYVANSGNEGKELDDGVVIVNGDWSKTKVDACALLRPRDYETDDDKETPPGPYARIHGGWIGWIDQHTAALTYTRRALPLLAEVVTGSKTGPNPDLQRQLAHVDANALFWMAGVGTDGSLEDVDPLSSDALKHASGLSVSVILGATLDAHVAAEQEVRHMGELGKSAAYVDTRLHEKFEGAPILQYLKTSTEGRSIKVDAHLDTAAVDLVAGLIGEQADRAIARNDRYKEADPAPIAPVEEPTPPAAAPPADTDADGITDDADKCPNDPEDQDGFQDADGCPDPDNDGDGIADAFDKCTSAPEDKNGFEDADGCPDETKRSGQLAKAESHTMSGQAFLKAKVYDKAIEEFTAAYALAPIPVLQYDLALAYDGQKDRPNALAAYRKYIDTDPDGARGKEGEYARTRIAQLTRDLKK